MDDCIQLRFRSRNCSMEIFHCQLQDKADWSRSSNKKKENCWRLPHLFSCLFLLLFKNCQLVSGKTWDGVVVTQSDYQALKALKHEFVDSRGVLKSWNDSGAGAGACSGWAGIKCVNGQVIAIQLPWKGLGGRISEKIGQLQALRRISLHDNVLVGPVPTSLGFLPNLRGVYLFNNRLSGSIPLQLGQSLKSVDRSYQLQSLALDHNFLSGNIPASLSKLTMLEELNLSQNQIKGDIPEGLGSLSSYVDTSLPCPGTPNIISSPSQGHLSIIIENCTKDIILIAAGALLVVLLILCCVLLCCLIRRKASSKSRTAKAGSTLKPVAAGTEVVESGAETGGKLVHFDGPFVTADDFVCYCRNMELL
ncbi:UNVERIFIED_CONTAM: putative inactive leucine-rich repeat receptor-like protein kinase IMK2 [Sesamum angustifolium]|uniref:Inactive leucine-rich repeat receptor-like protein kinase IMK2 n=1 Tax=Sesamum angustifolium TaxID=2727405 RepID=A0AAW2MNG1_9LAMI